MPVKPLPHYPDIRHLKQQARDLLKAHHERNPQAAQRIREFHLRFGKGSDTDIFNAPLRISDAQSIVAREYGFPSWAKLRKRTENHSPVENCHDRIENTAFRRAVDLLDMGDAEGLRDYLRSYPDLVHQRVVFEGVNYFSNPTLLEFIAENPVRRGSLPDNIVAVTKVILDAGANHDSSAVSRALTLVCSGRVVRECKAQIPLIDLLCAHGADPNSAMAAALVHGEFEAVNALISHGARLDLLVAAALGRIEDAARLLEDADEEDRHRGLALAAQFGHVEIVRLLLHAGEGVNRYNPIGFHSHATVLHQAAAAGHYEVVQLLVERGAKLDVKDTLWQATPADWARHEGRTEIEGYLRAVETARS